MTEECDKPLQIKLLESATCYIADDEYFNDPQISQKNKNDTI